MSQNPDQNKPLPPHGRAKAKSISNGAIPYKAVFKKPDISSESASPRSGTPMESQVPPAPSSSQALSNKSSQEFGTSSSNTEPKKVSFLNLKMFQWGLELNSSSITSSEDDQNYDDEEQEEDVIESLPNSKSTTSTTTPPSVFKKYELRRLISAPIGYSQSLDSQILNSNDLSLNLPVFNKRPPTDTPIVSYVASPETREESDEDFESKSKDLCDRLKKISHLNLTDLNLLNTTSLNTGMFDPTPPPPPPESKAVPRRLVLLKRTPVVSATTASIPAAPTRPKITLTESGELLPTVDVVDKIQDSRREISEKLHQELDNLLHKTRSGPAKRASTLNIPGQTSLKVSPDGRIASADVGSKLIIVMVGLPARGKSYITNKLTRYLNWLQHDCRVFNVGNTRRKDVVNNAGPEAQPLPDLKTPLNETASGSPGTSHLADFFSPDNTDSTAIREKWAMDTLDNLLNYVIDGPGSVGIFDATNSTKKRRSWVLKRIQERSKGELKVLFLESICSDHSIIESNIRLKLSGPDYRKMNPEEALKDFVGRLRNYEKAYETIDELEEAIPGFQYVKMINVGKKVVSYNIQGFLASQTIYFLLNFNLCERQIWLTRHGESEDNLTGRIGGDSPLTKRGLKFARALSNFMEFQRKEFRKEQLKQFSTRLELKYNSFFDRETDKIDTLPTEPNFCVWTSMLLRAVETGQYFDDQFYSVKEMRMLNELGGGKYEGLTYEEIQSQHPKEFQARIRSKLTYRYPGGGGESYLDVLTRLRPLITEIERTTDNLLIISHRVVLRILLAYFLNLDKTVIGDLDVPLHTLYCLELKPYGNNYRMYEFDEKLEWFKKVEPDHRKNMKEVGVEFRQRKYSVVPTAPPSHRQSSGRQPSNLNETVNRPKNIRRSISYDEVPEGVRQITRQAKEAREVRQATNGEKKGGDVRKLRGT